MTDPNAIRETIFCVSQYIDEVMPHGPTLPEAAAFLAGAAPEDEDTENAGKPRAEDGDLIEVTCWQYIGDRTAVYSDGSWRLEPPIPELVQFLAHRTWGNGWGEEDCIGPPDGLAQHFSHCIGDPAEHTQGPIACAYETEVLMQFRILDGQPVLIPTSPEDQIAWLQLRLLRSQRSAEALRRAGWDKDEEIERLKAART